MTIKYLSAISFLLIFSCNTERSKTNDEFERYLSNFQKVELPLIIKGCNVNPDSYKRFSDSSKYVTGYSLPYGQAYTNGAYVAVITLGAADCYLPILTTYKPNGEIIDEKGIAIGRCGGDCGFTCEEFMTLRKDFTFYASDTITTYECDSLGNETPGTHECYVAYIEGKVKPDGTIEMSEEIKKKFPRRKEVK